MADLIRWSPRAPVVTALAGDGPGPSLRNLATGARVLGAPIDNTSAGHLWADWELACRFGTAPAAGLSIALYLIPALDGATLADGSASIEPAASCFVGAFPVRPVATAQRVTLTRVPFPSGVFAALMVNSTSQGLSDVAGENVLRFVSYAETIG